MKILNVHVTKEVSSTRGNRQTLEFYLCDFLLHLGVFRGDTFDKKGSKTYYIDTI